MRELSFFESIVHLSLSLVFGVGYLINLVAAFNTHGDEVALRAVGIIIPPIGVILGYLM